MSESSRLLPPAACVSTITVAMYLYKSLEMVENPGELQKAKIPLVLKLLRESKAIFFFFYQVVNLLIL